MTKFETEWAKMLAGEVYEAGMTEFADLLYKVRAKIREFNDLHPLEAERMECILRGLFGSCGKNLHVNQPFRCDYGCNIFVGDNFFANFNLTILDEAPVTFGDNVFIGPNVSIFTACHPLDPVERARFVEWAEPVTVGSNVWIGGGAILLPGITVGDNSVIGAGAVVTRDVPSGVVVGGNPAKVIKKI